MPAEPTLLYLLGLLSARLITSLCAITCCNALLQLLLSTSLAAFSLQTTQTTIVWHMHQLRCGWCCRFSHAQVTCESQAVCFWTANSHLDSSFINVTHAGGLWLWQNGRCRLDRVCVQNTSHALVIEDTASADLQVLSQQAACQAQMQSYVICMPC